MAYAPKSRADEVGATFGGLTIVGSADGTGKRRVLCRCVCGSVRSYRWQHVSDGTTKSCGCLKGALISDRRSTHGHARHGSRHGSLRPEYQAWVDLKRRCHDPNHPAYRNYGARGIAACERWRESYDAFFSDIGARPTPGHSLDRINVDGDYEPGNVRWATDLEQRRNRRNTQRLTVAGVTRPLTEWAVLRGLSAATMRNRLLRGWDDARTVNTPARAMEKAHLKGSRVLPVHAEQAAEG